MKNQNIFIEVFTFTDIAQTKLKRLGFSESITNNEDRGVKTFDILLSNEKYNEVHLCFTEILDEELFRIYEERRQIQPHLLFKPRILVQEFINDDLQINLNTKNLSLNPLQKNQKLAKQIVHQQYGFVIVHETTVGKTTTSSSAQINAHLQSICLHPRLMASELMIEDLLEIPYLLIDEKSEPFLYFQLRKESGCVAVILDYPNFKDQSELQNLPVMRLAGREYLQVKENPLDLDILIPSR